MVNRWYHPLVCAFMLLGAVIAQPHAQEVRLVGNKVETLINDRGQPSRLTDLIEAALANENVTLTATTQAWSGSGLRNGRFDGYIDHYSLDNPKLNYVYSKPFANIALHVASTSADAANMNRLDQLNRKRVGLETRFANTDQVRSERSVNWARTQDFFNNVQQLAEQRVNYIVADKIMLDEMNKMLIAVGQEPLYISSEPLFSVDISLGMRTAFADAQSVITKLNEGIERLKTTQQYDEIYLPSVNAKSILDETMYEDIVKRW
ncbi:substrate-binding periplasmic protein [Glaciecola siphonariae]|uniref:Substrate-binding periplasmic protein n=1 Tax=Glaciecola siphonariae TaxID=521012 RepID=A0ABV9LY11_9ALTE